MTYESNTRIKLEASGTGGVESLASYCNEKALFFAYVKVKLSSDSDDETGSPCKFILISFAGDRAPFIRKAKMGVHKTAVKEIFRDYAKEFQASDSDDLNPEVVLAAVKKAAGANYAGQSSYKYYYSLARRKG